VPRPLLAPENDYGSLGGVEIDQPDLRVTVVVPVYNRVDLLKRTVAGLATQTYPGHLLDVVIADDGSSEDVAAGIAGFGDEIDITVVRREHDGYGAGQARNLGARNATDADVLVFFDADCIPDLQAVERHAVWHHAADNLVVIGSRHQVDTSDLTPERVMNDPAILRELAFSGREPRELDWESKDFRAVLHRRTASLRQGDQAFRSLVSSNFSVSAESFSRVGGFSEDFTRWGGEDTELGWRLWNEGNFFVDEPRAAMFHQLQTDAGPEGWRLDERRSNEGLIQSKIPHRFYRSPADTINETPKVSVVIHHPVEERLDELVGQLLAQRLGDLEIVLVGDSDVVAGFVERRAADPRFSSAPTVERALETSHGEFVALVSGAAGLDHRLLSRSVAALERRPRSGLVRSAYGIRHADGADVYRRHDDIGRLDETWCDGLPVFGLTRRRDLMKVLRGDGDSQAAWSWVTESLERIDHGTPLVWLASRSPSPDGVVSVTPPRSLRGNLLDDIRSGGSTAVTAPLRAIRSVLTREPYRPTTATTAESGSLPASTPPVIRYVGWTGRSNLGDEAMLAAVNRLFDWADLTTEGNTGDVLMLGGGTLINRGYLKRLRPLDSPSRERIVFGTGVANPSYWGDPTEPLDEWIAFLESCAYVGVRGPISARLLDEWGMRRQIRVIGDPALSLTPSSDVSRVDGRVVVCPAWSRGLLWGDSDADVFTAFAGTVTNLRQRGHEVWALSAFPSDDRFIIGMMRDAGAPDLPYLAAHDDPMSALYLLASADLVIAERLHAAVLAAAAGTVPVMVEYRPKIRDFAESIDLTDLVITTDGLTGGALTELSEEAYRSRQTHHEQMMSAVTTFRDRQREAAGRIRALLEAQP
jgi:glycosyltransferase involved in cell wall biosynthesis